MPAALSYTCPTDKSICYSVNSPATNGTFQDLQAQINRFASVAGFAPIAQDGLIGDGTTTAAKKALSYAIGRLPDGTIKATLILYQPLVVARQTLAASAEIVGQALKTAAVALDLWPSGPSSGGGGGMTATPVPTMPLPPVSIPLVPAQGLFSTISPTKKALIGVGASVGIGALLLFFWPKKKRSK